MSKETGEVTPVTEVTGAGTSGQAPFLPHGDEQPLATPLRLLQAIDEAVEVPLGMLQAAADDALADDDTAVRAAVHPVAYLQHRAITRQLRVMIDNLLGGASLATLHQGEAPSAHRRVVGDDERHLALVSAAMMDQ